MTNRELQEELKKYPDDYEVIYHGQQMYTDVNSVEIKDKYIILDF